MLHRQPLTIAGNDPRTGPKTGPLQAPRAHTPIISASVEVGHRSLMLAPPVARAGEPRTPVRKRKTRMQAKLLEKTMGSWKMMKSRRVMM